MRGLLKEMKSESNYEDIIKKNLQIIAKREGISEEKVREDILYAISLALKSDDPKVREFWKLIPCKGESPTVDETLNYLIMKAASENI